MHCCYTMASGKTNYAIVAKRVSVLLCSFFSSNNLWSEEINFSMTVLVVFIRTYS